MALRQMMVPLAFVMSMALASCAASAPALSMFSPMPDQKQAAAAGRRAMGTNGSQFSRQPA